MRGQCTYTLGELARFCGVEVEGDPRTLIEGVGTLEGAEPGEITFLTNPLYRAYLGHTRAAAVILRKQDREATGLPCLITDNPHGCYAQVARKLFPEVRPRPGIHRTAVVHPEAELRKLLTLKPGDLFSREKVTSSTKAIADRLAQDGYSFANINANPEIDKEHHTAAFTFVIDPGRRVYVRRVNIYGNTTTRDEVIRREIRQMEGAWYSVEKVNRSKERIDRLGFFSEVTVDSPPVPGTTDQVDVNFTVAERQTGSIQLGAGYSNAEGIILSAGITQSNLFGSGNSLSFGVSTGLVTRTYSVAYTNPYWTEEGVARTISLYDRSIDTSYLIGVSPYSTRTLGADVTYTIPVSEVNAYSLGYGFEATSVGVFNTSPAEYVDFVNQFGSQAKAIKVSMGYTHDTRDSIIYPMKGWSQKYGVEVGVPGENLTYYRATASEQVLTPVSLNTTLSLSGQLGYANGYGGVPLPFYKNFFAGGVGSVRGYFPGSLGPQVSTFSGGKPNSQQASISSSPLFIMVAESTEIFLPMRHFGC